MGNCCLIPISACFRSCLRDRRGYVNIETNKIDKSHKEAPKTVPSILSTVSQAPTQPPAKTQPILVNSQAETGGSKGGFFSKYDLREKEEIGTGSTSKCFKCVRRSDKKEFACKVIDKQKVEVQFNGLMDQFNVEIKILKLLNHPNIIHLEDSFETSDRIYMVMEIMRGGELFDYVVEKGTITEEEACILVRKVTSVVAHMHGMNIIHRDLKPENLLLTSKYADAEIKLIDFGLAKEVGDAGAAKSFLGTRGYLAPEMLQRGSYDKAVDIWALGVIVFVLLCGCLPFDDDSSRINEADAKKKFTLRFPKWASNLSAPAKDLLQHLLDTNPKTRYTAQQALDHPWVSGKTVQLNNYLQSPSMMLERRKELRSPRVTHETYGSSNGKKPATTLDVIREETHNSRNVGGMAPGLVRKNSI